MKFDARVLLAAAVVLPLVTACQTNEQTGTLLGAGGGAVAGGLLGNAIGGRTGAIVGVALGGLAGGFAGSQIGRQLDQRDRERAEGATRQALVGAPSRRVNWASDSNQGVRGTSTVTNVQRQANGGECRTVRETAYIKGQEMVQNPRYCQNRDGQWLQQT